MFLKKVNFVGAILKNGTYLKTIWGRSYISLNYPWVNYMRAKVFKKT
jgi:hypothetical protein